MGAVFKARHRLMDRIVALKVIRKEFLDQPQTVERFRQEVKAAARLAHPNIVGAFDAEQSGDVHFLVMEYVEDIGLDRLIQIRGPLPVSTACDYICQAAHGFQHAFERGMVHRDIKPANLLVDEHGDVRIADFGLARLMERSQALTPWGAVVGTPDYTAPEQAHDAQQADIRADIYSLGCTLYHLLAGRPPFPDGGVLQKLLAHQNQQARPLNDVRTDVPVELAKVVERMMAKEPAQRYATPAEVAGALECFAITSATEDSLPVVEAVPLPSDGSADVLPFSPLLSIVRAPYVDVGPLIQIVPGPPSLLFVLGVPPRARRFASSVPVAVVYSTAIAPPPPVPQYALSPPRASTTPAPPTVAAVIHTDPPAPPRSL